MAYPIKELIDFAEEEFLDDLEVGEYEVERGEFSEAEEEAGSGLDLIRERLGGAAEDWQPEHFSGPETYFRNGEIFYEDDRSLTQEILESGNEAAIAKHEEMLETLQIGQPFVFDGILEGRHYGSVVRLGENGELHYENFSHEIRELEEGDEGIEIDWSELVTEVVEITAVSAKGEKEETEAEEEMDIAAHAVIVEGEEPTIEASPHLQKPTAEMVEIEEPLEKIDVAETHAEEDTEKPEAELVSSREIITAETPKAQEIKAVKPIREAASTIPVEEPVIFSNKKTIATIEIETPEPSYSEEVSREAPEERLIETRREVPLEIAQPREIEAPVEKIQTAEVAVRKEATAEGRAVAKAVKRAEERVSVREMKSPTGVKEKPTVLKETASELREKSRPEKIEGVREVKTKITEIPKIEEIIREEKHPFLKKEGKAILLHLMGLEEPARDRGQNEALRSDLAVFASGPAAASYDDVMLVEERDEATGITLVRA